MKIPRKDAAKTRKRLLAAAIDVFADKGYRDTTIAEICERAGTNIAAVNYHFGHKESLYIEAWRHSFLESVKAHPSDGGVSAEAPPEERLRGRVAALLHRIADEGNKEFSIVRKELANPTGILNEAMQEVIRPLGERMEGLVRELLGPHVWGRPVQFCVISIISQCINPMVFRETWKAKGVDSGDFPRIDDIEAYADHVTRFALAGIHAIRREQAEKSEGASESNAEAETP